jgi:hypothetical protein
VKTALVFLVSNPSCQVQDARLPKDSEARAVPILSFIRGALEEPLLQSKVTFSKEVIDEITKFIVEVSFDGINVAGTGHVLGFVHMRSYLVSL